ncbi:MAG TPA: PAS domain S-box protein, partial [Daejeonella sp.]|nr:PAS domain S-box protein [Daejeonella sp.]
MNKLKGLNGLPLSSQDRERELLLRIEELTDFIDNASIPLHWVNAEGKIIWANQAELDILGFTKDEYIGHQISDFHVEPEVINDILSRLTNNETLRNYPAKLRCKNGSVKDVLINSNVLRKNGEFIHTRCFTRDVTEFRKDAQRKEELILELEQSEARLRMAMNSTRMGTWDYNPITGELTWSDECKRIYGIPHDSPVTYEMFHQHVHPEDIDFVQKEISRAMDPSGDGRYDISYRIVRFDCPEVVWIRAQGKVYLNAARQAERFIGTVTDITEANQAEEKSAKLAAIIESSEDAIISKTLDGVITSWNNSAERIFGYKTEEILGQSILILIPPERQFEEPEILVKLRRGERIDHFETKRLTKDGRLIDISLSISQILDSQGRVIGISKIARDISEKNQAARLVVENEEHLRLAVKAADLGTFDMNLNTRLINWDSRCAELFGYEERIIYEQELLHCLHEDDRKRVHEVLGTLFQNVEDDSAYDLEFRTVGPTGNKLRWVRAIGKVLNDSQGKPERFIGTMLDISGKKQEELRKNDFIAIISHELKTPLTSIKSYIQLLLSKAKKESDPFMANALSRAEIQASKMASMIEDFLSLARLEEGKVHLNKEIFDLHLLTNDVVNDSQCLTTSHRIVCKNFEGLKVFADRDKIGQVLINLLSNAIKYSPRGGTITISREASEGKVTISVTDEGIGISTADQDRLFDRFFR